jgi:SAM-dependent methyltransferase
MDFDREKNVRKRGLTKGLYGDDYGVWMSNYLPIAEHAGIRLSGKLVLELCCGLGVTTIGLSRYARHVYSIDWDSIRVADAIKNLDLYNLGDRVTFLVGDCMNRDLLIKTQVDAVYIDPGWKLKDEKDWSVIAKRPAETEPPIPDAFQLVSTSVASDIIVRVPPGFTYDMMSEMDDCELESIYLNGRLVFKYAYYGTLKKLVGETTANIFLSRSRAIQ